MATEFPGYSLVRSCRYPGEGCGAGRDVALFLIEKFAVGQPSASSKPRGALKRRRPESCGLACEVERAGMMNRIVSVSIGICLLSAVMAAQRGGIAAGHPGIAPPAN